MIGSVMQCIAFLTNQISGEFEVRKYKPKRSKRANAYYWKLVEMITEERRKDGVALSTNQVHRELMESYGAWEYDENGELVTSTNIVGHLSRCGYFTKPIAMVEMVGIKNGKKTVEQGEVRICVRGSHTYESHDMNNLIQGAVMEAQNLGIQTMTPQEIEQMIADMGEA